MSSSTFLSEAGFEAAVEAAAASEPKRSLRLGPKVLGPVSGKPGESWLEVLFAEAGTLGPVLADGQRTVRCPWEALHTTGTTFDGSTVLFPPCHGSDIGHFHCSHSHCDGRDHGDAIEALPADAVERACQRMDVIRLVRNDEVLRPFAGLRHAPTSTQGHALGTTLSGVGPPVTSVATEENFTDVGNAKRLVSEHGYGLRFVHARNSWLVWDGTRWQYDERGYVDLCAKSTVTALLQRAVTITDDDAKRRVIAHALKSEAVGRIGAMVQLAQSEPGVPVVPRELDQHHHLLNLQNGTLDLTTGVLFPHDPRLLVTKLAPVTFDPTAQAPEWLKFVNAVFANDADLISYVQRVVGYALGGWVTAQMLVFFYGLGSNGKTTFLETIAGLLGDYAAPAAPGLLLEKKHESHPTEIADLQGRRLVISMEVDVAQKLSEALVKQLTGGDTLKARFMGGDFFEFEPTHKLFLAANHKPIIHGNDLGIWRRIKLIPFGVSFTGAQQDLNLKAKLMAELSGILNWLLQGCLDFQRYGFATSKAVDDATSAYREESDRLAGFLADCCMKGPECERSSVLYQAYLTWCTQNGETPVQQRTFGTMLRERGFEPTKLHGNAGWKGLRVVTEIERRTLARLAGEDGEDVPGHSMRGLSMVRPGSSSPSSPAATDSSQFQHLPDITPREPNPTDSRASLAIPPSRSAS